MPVGEPRACVRMIVQGNIPPVNIRMGPSCRLGTGASEGDGDCSRHRFIERISAIPEPFVAGDSTDEPRESSPVIGGGYTVCGRSSLTAKAFFMAACRKLMACEGFD